ncbi:hypothetical protein aq_1400 [Aquifex aeolicus VF5]|uniref:Cyclic di-GMP-binding protein n=1 Tax=Aquifex aeolicus (strain VF5) TaxID=224324 RepID=O67400_AQUAE|nr:hypothetical protein aq_1400 [Aquifex aeolicus VF5]
MALSFSQTTSVKLSEFLGKNVLDLKGMDARGKLSFPVNPLWNVEKIKFYIYYKASPVLKSERSEITLLLNGKVITSRQIKDEGLITVEIENPKLFDFNTLTFKASQHYCINCCENENSPELWTQIDLKKSYIQFQYTKKPFPENLAFLKDIYLSERLLSPVEIDILTDKGSNRLLTAGAIFSGYLGAKIKYRRIYVNYTENLRAKDTVVIGTQDFVSRVIGERVSGNIYVTQNPKDKSKFLLVFTGRDEKEILNAVRAFILTPSSYLSEKFVYVSDVVLPEIKAYSSPVLLAPGEEITLRKIAGGDVVVRGYAGRFDFSFFIPPDLMLNPKEKLRLKLFYNHGLLVREGSTINLYINGKFVYSIPVDPYDKSDLKVREVLIPTSVLNKGFNVLTVESALVPNKEDFCAAANFESLKVIIYGNSLISLPDLVHWTKMPNLVYFISTGFPFTTYPDMKDAAVLVESTDGETLSSMFTLLAFIGTKIQFPPLRLSVYVDRLPNDVAQSKDVIVFWNRNSLIKKQILNSLDSVVLVKGKLFEEDQKEFSVNLRKRDYVFTMAMRESPFKPKRTILVLNSKSPGTLHKFVKMLYDPVVLSKIKGDTVFYDEKTDTILSSSSGQVYYIGHMPVYKKVYYEIGYNLKYLVGLLLISLLVLAFATKKLLDYRAKKRHQQEEKEGKEEEKK